MYASFLRVYLWIMVLGACHSCNSLGKVCPTTIHGDGAMLDKTKDKSVGKNKESRSKIIEKKMKLAKKLGLKDKDLVSMLRNIFVFHFEQLE